MLENLLLRLRSAGAEFLTAEQAIARYRDEAPESGAAPPGQ